ncbi:MAG TPA: hypothetical protein PK185_02620 [Cyclobacteriaceae bacterium]|nr:hypothetical protein [Cyclobacteriaceae bacterium]
MKTQIVLLALIANSIVSCITKKDQSSNEPSGTYTREYSFEVVHPETGVKIGKRTIRDTFLIRSLDEGYEVSNSKWMKNDYDENGWRDMEHAEDRPFVTYPAKYDSKNNSLTASDGTSLRFEPNSELVLLGRGIVYKKVVK